MPQSKFQPQQAVDLAEAFQRRGVDYLFIGKSGAILLGYPAITQDVDLHVPKNPENGRKIIAALEDLGFPLEEELKRAIVQGKDFVQIKSGPFDIDLIHAPDGIESFEEAKARRVMHDNFPVASLADIIASKRASGREKDLVDLPLLEQFREEFERRYPKPLKSRADITRGSNRGSGDL
jgi:hypothetical protein